MIVLELVGASKQMLSPTPLPPPQRSGGEPSPPAGRARLKGEPLWGGVGSLLVRVNGAGGKIKKPSPKEDGFINYQQYL